jgi:hypothetical protein
MKIASYLRQFETVRRGERQHDIVFGGGRLPVSLSGPSLKPVGGLKNQTTSFFGVQTLVAHADADDTPICVPAYSSGDRPLGMKLGPGARRRTRTVSWWCSSRSATAAREYAIVPFHFANALRLDARVWRSVWVLSAFLCLEQRGPGKDDRGLIVGGRWFDAGTGDLSRILYANGGNARGHRRRRD